MVTEIAFTGGIVVIIVLGVIIHKYGFDKTPKYAYAVFMIISAFSFIVGSMFVGAIDKDSGSKMLFTLLGLMGGFLGGQATSGQDLSAKSSTEEINTNTRNN